jgi:hypothetical protein
LDRDLNIQDGRRAEVDDLDRGTLLLHHNLPSLRRVTMDALGRRLLPATLRNVEGGHCGAYSSHSREPRRQIA